MAKQCRCTHPECLRSCGCRLSQIACTPRCGCGGTCPNSKPVADKEAVDALKANNVLLTQLLQVQLTSALLAAQAAAVPAAAPSPAAAALTPAIVHSLPPAAHHNAGVIVNAADAGAVAGSVGHTALALPSINPVVPASTEHVFWERLRSGWQSAVTGDLDPMHRLLHPQLAYEVQLTHNGQVVRYVPPGNSHPNVAFCSLFPAQGPLSQVHIFPFQSSQQMQVEGGRLGLAYEGPCAYQTLIGQYLLRLLFEQDKTFGVHLVCGFSLKLDFR